MFEIKEEVINRAKNKMPETGFNAAVKHLSSYDLEKVLESHGTLTGNSLLEVLWSLGFDTQNYEITEQYAYHRPVLAKTSEPWYGKRWIGMERKDAEWVNSKYSSLDVRVATAGFSDLGDIVGVMGRQSNFTGDLLDHMRNKKDVNHNNTEVNNESEDTDPNTN